MEACRSDELETRKELERFGGVRETISPRRVKRQTDRERERERERERGEDGREKEKDFDSVRRTLN